MRILCISNRNENVSVEQIQAVQVEEARKVWELYSEGLVREIYFDKDRVPQPKGILILEADDREAAKKILSNLPMVAAGFIDFELYVLGPYSQLGLAFQ